MKQCTTCCRKINCKLQCKNRCCTTKSALQTAEEKTIKESEAYNKVLFSDSAIALVVLDPQSGLFTDCNQAAVTIYGLPDKTSLIGLAPAELSPTNQYDGTSSAQSAALRIQQASKYGSVLFDWHHRHADGTEWDAKVLDVISSQQPPADAVQCARHH